ncbi:MAG TPA: His-Xaa-Ser system protein HxsD [Thermoanaerobaculia bacterium]|nr:His-Xaa-Ser system protein HxsD [Thermoanaerobaculia bacterium]
MNLYSASAVLRACYRHSDRLYSYITPAAESPGTLVVSLWTLTGEQVTAEMIGEFCADLADQELREQLAEKTAPIRELIVAQAFAEGNLFSPSSDDADYETDPLDIASRR